MIWIIAALLVVIVGLVAFKTAPTYSNLDSESEEWERLKAVNQPVTTPASWEYALPSEITDSIFRRIEGEWDRAHPDPKDEKIRELYAQIYDQDRLIKQKSAAIAQLRGSSFGVDWSFDDDQMTVMGRPVLVLEKNLTESQIQTQIRKAFDQMAKTAILPDSGMIVIPKLAYTGVNS